jgi:hypothetical protein
MTIKQLNATYLAADDRLLFRFNTVEDKEFRFWFTRRVTLFILAATQHLIVKSLEQTHTPEAAKALAEFGKETLQANQSEQGVAQVDVYVPANTYPMGADPVLVIDVKCALEKQGSEDLLSLDLMLPGNSNINLKLSGPILQAMCILLNQLREHAVWGEAPQVIEANLMNQDIAAESKKPLIH